MKDRIKHYLLSHAFMDSQHQGILMALDDLRKLSHGHKLSENLLNSAEGIALTLQGIESTLREHFSAEEEAMRNISYPYIASHSANHIESMRVFSKMVKSPSLYTISDAITEILKHIDYFDRQFAEYCTKKIGEVPETSLS